MFCACSFVSLSMGLSACNSSGHLSNHADIAPNHAGVTFAISNTLVRFDPSVCLHVLCGDICLQCGNVMISISSGMDI